MNPIDQPTFPDAVNAIQKVDSAVNVHTRPDGIKVAFRYFKGDKFWIIAYKTESAWKSSRYPSGWWAHYCHYMIPSTTKLDTTTLERPSSYERRTCGCGTPHVCSHCGKPNWIEYHGFADGECTNCWYAG